MMSASDIKHSLKKLDFPECAKEALIKIDQMLTGRLAPSNKQLDSILELIAEFIFCEVDRRSSRRANGLNSRQELQLIDAISSHLSTNTNETTKNTIFLSLFSGTDSQKRMSVLSKLASLAISAFNKPMLSAVGVWLQQTGCSSHLSLQLAEYLIRDHFQLTTTNQSALKSLAEVAPQFVANFMTAITELYLHHDSHGKPRLPPRNLLEVVTAWVYSNSKLCMSAQLNPAALPPGSIPMAAVTPLSGLIHWCVLAPLYIQRDTDTDIRMIESSPSSSKQIKLAIKCESNAISQDKNTLSDAELYRKLHVGVLHSLFEGRRTQGPPTAVNAQHLAAIVQPIQAFSSQLLKAGFKPGEHKPLQEALDRIGQSTQVALANGCVYGNLSNLLVTLDSLPKNRLLTIVIKTHFKSI